MRGEHVVDLTIIIPAYNEEEGIAATLERLGAEPGLAGAQIVVVDDGSTDRTAEVAGRFPLVKVICHKMNKGYGAAIKTGVRNSNSAYVAWYDADGQHLAGDLANMYTQIHTQGIDAVVGERTRDSLSLPSRRIGKFFLSLAVRLVAKGGLADFNCGLRVVRRALLNDYLPFLPDGVSASTTLTLLLLQKDVYFSFFPVTAAQRIGTSSIHQLRDGLRALHTIMRILILFKPLRVFGAFSALFISAGLAYGVFKTLTVGSGFPVFAAVVILSGVILLFMGLICDQISALRLEMAERSRKYHESDPPNRH